MKIIILDNFAANPGDISLEPLHALGEVTAYDRTVPEEAAARIGDADAVLTNKVSITKEIMDACPNLKYIGVLATGFNIVDLDAARAHGITVTNIPAYSTDSVGQFTFALLLEVCHHVGHHSAEIANGRWVASEDFCFWDYPLIELVGKTLGIIGYGSIGQKVGAMAQAFGMEVLYYARHRKEELENAHVHYASQDELFAKSNVISLHCPLNADNQGLICAESIAKMKDGVILINTARGGLIAEQDLADALNSGKIAAAALDVVSKEPMEKDNPLLHAKNCIMTPHIAWAPLEARQRLADICAANIRAYQEGHPVNVVS